MLKLNGGDCVVVECFYTVIASKLVSTYCPVDFFIYRILSVYLCVFVRVSVRFLFPECVCGQF